MTFRVISLVAVIALAAVLAGHWLARGRHGGGTAAAGPRHGFITRALYALLLVCVLTLIVTGLGPTAIVGAAMEGWMLVIHVATGTAFAVCLALAGVLWAERQAQAGGGGAVFWLALAVGLVLIGTVAASMLGWASSAGIGSLFVIHQYAGLAMALLIIAHLYQRMLEWRYSKHGAGPASH